jgi:hypothetical protein
MPVNVVPALQQALRQLEAEKARLDQQIAAVRSALDGVGVKGPRRRRRGGMSPAARRAASRRMKAYWAKRRATSGSNGRVRKEK